MRRRNPTKKKCAVCGAAFVPEYSFQKCCSKACSAENHRRNKARYKAAHPYKRLDEKRGPGATFHRVEQVAQGSLFTAKRKPAGTSDVRWRMELSRRRLAAVGLLDMLPDPDMLA